MYNYYREIIDSVTISSYTCSLETILVSLPLEQLERVNDVVLERFKLHPQLLYLVLDGATPPYMRVAHQLVAQGHQTLVLH